MHRPPRRPHSRSALRRPRWWGLPLLLAGFVLVAALSPPAGPAGAQDDDAPAVATTLRPLPDDAGRIITGPNSGVAPDDPGDRGGWQQTVVLLLVTGAVGVGGLLVWRESTRKRRRAVAAGPRS